MSNEEFDKKIRDKFLNETDPMFSPTDWARFSGKFGQPAPPPAWSWGNLARPFGIAAAAAVVGVLVYQNIESNAKIGQNRELVDRQQVATQSGNSTNSQNLDTQNRGTTVDSAAQISEKTTPPSIDAKSGLFTQPKVKFLPPVPKLNFEIQKVESTDSENLTNNLTNIQPSRPRTQEEILVENPIKNSTKISENKAENTSANNLKNQEEKSSEAISANNLNFSTENQNFISERKNTYLEIEQLRRTFPLLATQTEKLDWSKVQIPVLPARKYAPVLGGGGLSVGLTGSAGRNMSSLGLALGWRFLGNFSLQTGIERAEILRGKFDDDRDFDRQTKREFRGMFEQGVQPNTRFKKIDFRSEFWQIPIALQYRTPRFKGFSALATAGMALNVDNKNKFEYEFETPAGSDAAILQQSDKNVGVLDQVSAGLGLQKDWRNFSFQLIQTIQHPLTAKVDSMPSGGMPPGPNPNPRPKPMGPYNQPPRNFGFSPFHLRLRVAYNF